MNNETTTENFNDITASFDRRKSALKLCSAWYINGLPYDFEDDGVTINFDRSNGNVYLVNSKHQRAMMNGNVLELYYTMPYSKHEGFLMALFDDFNSSWHPDDIQYLKDICTQEERYDLLEKMNDEDN